VGQPVGHLHSFGPWPTIAAINRAAALAAILAAVALLKILEEKGVAASSYVLNDDQTGPGRSQIVFYPTNKAAQFLTQLREEVRNSGDWQKVKQRMLRQLDEARQNNPVDALRAALPNLAEAKPSFNYCAEMISVLLINIQRLRDQKLLPALDTLNIPGQVGLGALAGLSLASTFTNEAEDISLTEKLLAHTQRFQTQLAEMSDDSIKRLSAFLADARTVLDAARKLDPKDGVSALYAGLYVPGGQGGKTPLVSSVLMNGIPAAIAGVKHRIMVTPPNEQGMVHPALLVAAQEIGISQIYKTGSAWAIAALAYGTAVIPAVDVKIGRAHV